MWSWCIHSSKIKCITKFLKNRLIKLLHRYSWWTEMTKNGFKFLVNRLIRTTILKINSINYSNRIGSSTIGLPRKSECLQTNNHSPRKTKPLRFSTSSIIKRSNLRCKDSLLEGDILNNKVSIVSHLSTILRYAF